MIPTRLAGVLLGIHLLALALPAHPVSVVPWLYEVAVPVASQAPAERSRASRDALLVMLSRTTGLAHVPRSELIKTALDNAESFYTSFGFTQTPEGDLELVVQFDPQAILELQKRAALPIWRSARERIVAWLVLDQNGVRTLVGAAAADPLVGALTQRARERGVDLSLPLLDLEDQLQVTPAVVWGQLAQVLEPASTRYGADALLVGRLAATAAADGSELWQADWELWLDNEVVPFETAAGDLAAQGSQIVDLIADELAARNAVLGTRSDQLQLAVSGIRNAADYAGLLDYLEGLEFIDVVFVRTLNGDRLRIDLLTRADAEQLRALFEADRKLFTDKLAAFDVADLQLVWRQR